MQHKAIAKLAKITKLVNCGLPTKHKWNDKTNILSPLVVDVKMLQGI